MPELMYNIIEMYKYSVDAAMGRGKIIYNQNKP